MESAALENSLKHHILSGNEDEFADMALHVFAYQFANNKPYQAFCRGRRQTPDTVQQWQDIPAAPASAFKRFSLSCVDPERCTQEAGGRTFHSSGTTGSETSRHYMDPVALRLYTESLHTSFAAFAVCGEEVPIIGLLAPPEQATHSSLSYMVGELIKKYTGAFNYGDNWQEAFLAQYATTSQPCIFFGTAFAWVQLLDTMIAQNITLRLPSGSRIIETGGFKGRSREIERTELYALFTERFGVPATHCLAEYGMSEMASQYYDTSFQDHQTGKVREVRKAALPHLLRTRVIDPVTGQETEPGIPGLLTHYDIANLNSCLAIQTEDWGYIPEDGEGLILLGRAPGAALRGCSLTAEEFAERQTYR